MNTTQIDYTEKINKVLAELPKVRLRSVLDYLEYLKDREAWEETQEILHDKKLMNQLKKADKDWNKGSYKEGDYVEWEKLKKNV